MLPDANKHGIVSYIVLSESSNDFPFKSTIDQTDGAIDTCGDSTGKLVTTNAMKRQNQHQEYECDDVEMKDVAQTTKHGQHRNGRIRQPKNIQQKANINKQPTAKNQQQITRNKRPATSNQQPAESYQ